MSCQPHRVTSRQLNSGHKQMQDHTKKKKKKKKKKKQKKKKKKKKK